VAAAEQRTVAEVHRSLRHAWLIEGDGAERSIEQRRLGADVDGRSRRGEQRIVALQRRAIFQEVGDVRHVRRRLRIQQQVVGVEVALRPFRENTRSSPDRRWLSPCEPPRPIRQTRRVWSLRFDLSALGDVGIVRRHHLNGLNHARRPQCL